MTSSLCPISMISSKRLKKWRSVSPDFDKDTKALPLQYLQFYEFSIITEAIPQGRCVAST